MARNLSPVPHPYTAEHAAFFLDHLVPKEWIWALTLKGDDRLAGVAGLTPDPEGQSGELGYWLDPDLWGRGLMTEADAAVTRFAFDELGWYRIAGRAQKAWLRGRGKKHARLPCPGREGRSL